MPDATRVPVLIGVGQLRANRERAVAAAREPLALMADALETAERDAGVPGLLQRADTVLAIRAASWAYADLAGAVAARIGARPRTAQNTALGGHLPARLLERAAAAIAAGDSEVAGVVGGEAQASVGALGKAGVDPVAELGWSAEPGGPPELDLAELGTAEQLAAGLFLPARVYPLYENRLQADLGLTPEQGAAWSARLYSDYSRIAAAHPAAWNREQLTPEQVGTPGPGNRMVCEPYPLAMNAMPHVDQAAAVVVTSLAIARAAGVPEERLTHVRGGAGADDHPDPLRRTGFGRSAALAAALDRARGRTGTTADELDVIDVYSCFPVVPKLAALHLGLDRHAVLSVAGGHSSFGGPLNTYSLHAIATLAQRLRGTGATGLVHANGGYLGSQHAIVLAGRPHPDGYVGDPEPERIEHPGAPALVDPACLAAQGADLVIETLTVEHGRSGGPQQAFVVGRTVAGDRLAVSSAPGDAGTAAALSRTALPDGATTHVGRTVRLTLRDGQPAVALPGGTA
ncbi:acetyl-CoA acetyltransferase [Blastococcus tunisiensis]|uniref:Acetyl-CoA C-acetyltransferase n=1 Tax=Blastococcus tunisiensis TaxID=1798228 RepID=A0A1I2EVW4_9ACTN|nr:acetyl-CoA acetyltransferase [Blastococcus sp. DSM 46838]SFE96757.1 acetyl-CoA C-acetyltransferase [Blastococcus sp. DSM 46838]